MFEERIGVWRNIWLKLLFVRVFELIWTNFLTYFDVNPKKTVSISQKFSYKKAVESCDQDTSLKYLLQNSITRVICVHLNIAETQVGNLKIGWYCTSWWLLTRFKNKCVDFKLENDQKKCSGTDSHLNLILIMIWSSDSEHLYSP